MSSGYATHPSRRWIEDPAIPCGFEPSPGFSASARGVALRAITFPDDVMIRTAIQVLCVVGEDGDLEVIRPFLEDATEDVRVDARCCLFERGIR